jgi:hypothetical protein
MTKLTTLSAFRTMLFGVKGAKPVTIITRTEPTLTGGKKCPLAGLVKISTVNGMINFNYENAVNRQRSREGNSEVFESAARKWGKRLYEAPEEVENPNSVQRIERKRRTPRHLPFVAKNWKEDTITIDEFNEIPNDELYLEMKVENSGDYIYMLNGEEIPKEKVAPYLPKKKEGERQDLEKTVILRDYKIENVEQITIDGESYKIAS